MKQNNKNLGFVRPVIEQHHYVFGSKIVPKLIIRHDGQWLNDIPSGEDQHNKYIETFGCVTYGTLNGLETLYYALYGKKVNRSDRFTYITSKTVPPGSDPHTVAEAVRNYGLVLESDLPFSSDIQTLDQYRSMGDKESVLLAKGKENSQLEPILHEWVFVNDVLPNERMYRLVECLQYSPIGISVFAWKQRENGLYYKDIGDEDNHWALLIGYEYGKKWFVYDSYPDKNGKFIKELEWEYDFEFAKRYYYNIPQQQNMDATTAPILKEIKPSLSTNEHEKVTQPAIIKSIFDLFIKKLMYLIKYIYG